MIVQANTRVDAVLLNPHANGGQAAHRWKKVLQAPAAKALGLEDAPCFQGPPSEAQAWVEGQLQAGAKRFLAAGGDGTVHLALNALLDARSRVPGSHPSLGALGLGSSNDFHKPYAPALGRARIAGFPARVDFHHAFPHDVGEVLVDGERRLRFVINASAGVTAQANHFFNTAGAAFRLLKRVSVGAAILVAALSTFARYRHVDLDIAADGRTCGGARLSNLGIVKNPCFAGSFRYPAGPGPDSGSFGVFLLEGLGTLGLVRSLLGLSVGRFHGRSFRARTLGLRSPLPFALETDGEVCLTRSARFSVLPKEFPLCP